MKVEDAIGDAKAANCPEIVHGIPPALAGVIEEKDLPFVFEEPEPPPPEPIRDIAAEVDDLKARIEKLEKKRGYVNE